MLTPKIKKDTRGMAFKAHKNQLNLAEFFLQKAKDQSQVLEICLYFEKAATIYKFCKLWAKAGDTYVELGDYLKDLDIKGDDVPDAYLNAAYSYLEGGFKNDAIRSFEMAVILFDKDDDNVQLHNLCSVIAEVYESLGNTGKAKEFYEMATKVISWGGAFFFRCKAKISQFSVEGGDYKDANTIFLEMARYSVEDEERKCGVKGQLLNAGLTQLLLGDMNAFNHALVEYEVIDKTFCATREYRFLVNIGESVQAEDVGRLSNVIKQYEEWSPLVKWKRDLLSTLYDQLKNKSNCKEPVEDEK